MTLVVVIIKIHMHSLGGVIGSRDAQGILIGIGILAQENYVLSRCTSEVGC